MLKNYGVFITGRHNVSEVARVLNIRDTVQVSPNFIKTERSTYTIIREGDSARGCRFDCIYFDDRIPWNVFRLLPYMLKPQHISDKERCIIPITF